MRFVQHPSNTRVLGAPRDWDHEKNSYCNALPITDLQVNGEPVVVSFWKPDEEELKRLNAGEPIALYIWGQTMPPVSVQIPSLVGIKPPKGQDEKKS